VVADTGLGFPDTRVTNGAAVAPGILQTLAQFAAPVPPVGRYRLAVYWMISGALETLPRNLKLRYNNADAVLLPTNMNGGVMNPPVVLERVSLDGVNPVQVQSVAAAVAGTNYVVILTGTRIG
jgi:hypothetical protein